ncbi:glyoxalase [Stutzerimonas stutzeri]|uniref:Glyoxalase n=1 Tax=Stutzerimonas stutzeri TaxID=316 RepID=A0A2S4AJ31_STUST|nr:VOC family protein [Stutzerimonas stutzeri]MCQ4264650.1 VOC family protein [Stutzerimonas stutzeri]POH81490.1 glyoxalase [Stutzerimonas stutzeri]
MEFLVNLDVDDLEQAVDFYGSVFGLQVGRRLGTFAVEMLGGPTPIYLLLKEAGSAATPGAVQSRDYGRHWTPIHLDFVVENIEAATARAVAHGARLEQPIVAKAGHKLALMADPFGHGFCLLQFVGQGYDELAI